jgi:hypothetical protein
MISKQRLRKIQRERGRSPETLVKFYQTSRCSTPDDSNVKSIYLVTYENLKGSGAVVYDTQNHWVYQLCLSSEILNNKVQ